MNTDKIRREADYGGKPLFSSFDLAKCVDDTIPPHIDLYFKNEDGSKVPFNLISGRVTDRHPFTLEKLDGE